MIIQKEKSDQMQIPRFRLQMPDSYIQKIAGLFSTGQIASGGTVSEFEKELEHMLGFRYVKTVSNGFAALLLSLRAVTETSGRTIVLIPGVTTCFAQLNAVLASGCSVEFYDIDERTLDYDIDSIINKMEMLKGKVAAVVTVDHFGFLSNVDRLKSLIKIPILDDCALSILTRYKNPGYSHPDLSIFSFYSTKGIPAVDGGAVATNDERFRNYVSDRVYYAHQREFDGTTRYNFKMNNINALVGLLYLEDIENIIKKRKIIQASYDSVIRSYTDKCRSIDLPEHLDVVYQKYVMMLNSENMANRFLKRMKEFGLGVSRELGFRGKKEDIHSFPNGIAIAKRLVSLPFYESLTQDEIEYTCEKLDLTIRAL
jgi:perosamine synthetase